MKRHYVAQSRYGYIGIDEQQEEGAKGCRTVLTGIKQRKLGYQIANLLNTAYQQGRDEPALDIAAAFTAINRQDVAHIAANHGVFSLETEVAK
jgi:hypothetical protein